MTSPQSVELSPVEIARFRRENLLIAPARETSAGGVAQHLGALQGQDTVGSLWAIGLRMANAAETDIDEALGTGDLVRTWPMRGTLHITPARDTAWMVKLLAHRGIAQAAGRARELGLDDEAFALARDAFTAAMAGGSAKSRKELAGVLTAAGVEPSGQRLSHLIRRFAQEGVICHGPRDGKQPAFMLLAERVPDGVRLDRATALAEIARRYFESHGPATMQDFIWWSGLIAKDARTGVAANKALIEVRSGPTIYLMRARDQHVGRDVTVDLLPAFDEYLLGYRSRDVVLDPAHAQAVCPGGNGVFMPVVLIGGVVAGIWKRTLRARLVVVLPQMFRRVSTKESRALVDAAERYGDFLGLPATVDWNGP